MAPDPTGAREAFPAALTFGVLFVPVLGLLAVSDAGDHGAATTSSLSAITVSASR
jgi:hypothetical protein